MKEFVLDLHTHTIASGHAYGTIREMAQAAAERGLQVLGLTEHGPGLPDACHPIYFLNLKNKYYEILFLMKKIINC